MKRRHLRYLGILHPKTLAAIMAALSSESRDSRLRIFAIPAAIQHVLSSGLRLAGIGGIAYTFRCWLEGHDALLKVPRYASRPKRDHWVLEHDLKKEATLLGALSAAGCSRVPALLRADLHGRFLFRTWIEGPLLSELDPTTTNRAMVLRELLLAAQELFQAFHESPVGCYVIRDFKPKNLVLSQVYRRIILLDVSSARPEKDMLPRTRSPYRVGSGKWLYWAPEQLLEWDGMVDRRVDYFSLGATAFFVLTGTAPYSNTTPDPRQLWSSYRSQQKGVTERLHNAAKEYRIPQHVVEFLEACLDPLPECRPVRGVVTW